MVDSHLITRIGLWLIANIHEDRSRSLGLQYLQLIVKSLPRATPQEKNQIVVGRLVNQPGHVYGTWIRDAMNVNRMTFFL